MRTNIKLAWRNIWRNKRRTLITVASIFFGVLLSTFLSSLYEGTYSRMINNIVSFYSGYLQIQHPDYWNNKSIENTFQSNDTLTKVLEQSPFVIGYTSRLESYALVSYLDNTKGAVIIGIDSEKENKISHLSHWVESGTFLHSNDPGILLTVNLAKNLGIEVGDTITLISQGYHGVGAAALFPVKGILKFPSPVLNNLGAYLDLTTAQTFFSADRRITSLVIMVDDYSNVNKLKQKLGHSIGKHYRIMTWNEMDPVTDNMVKADGAQNKITKGILFTLIGFGIFGTVLMMMVERRKEIAIMIAIGMQKGRLNKILFYETIMIGLLGILTGFALSFPLMQYLVFNPIPVPGETGKVYEQFGFEPVFYFSTQWPIFVDQILIVLGICLLVYLFPLIKTFRLKISKVLHS